jgi:hypothetical protein
MTLKILSLSQFQTSSIERDFVKSIEKGFSRFDEHRSRLVFQKFEVDYNLSKGDIFQNPQLFSKTIQNIFRFGSSYVERDIIAQMKRTFPIPDRTYVNLADAVTEIRKL